MKFSFYDISQSYLYSYNRLPPGMAHNRGMLPPGGGTPVTGGLVNQGPMFMPGQQFMQQQQPGFYPQQHGMMGTQIPQMMHPPGYNVQVQLIL